MPVETEHVEGHTFVLLDWVATGRTFPVPKDGYIELVRSETRPNAEMVVKSCDSAGALVDHFVSFGVS